MLHHEVARVIQFLMPDPQRGAESRAIVARRWLHVDLVEGCVCPNLAVGHGVHAAAAGEAELVHLCALPEPVEDVERGLLVDDLERVGEILVVLGDLLVLTTCVARAMSDILHRSRRVLASG